MKRLTEMACECGLLIDINDRISTSRTTSFHVESCYFDIENFAALVRADEREACAKVCENIDDYDENVDTYYSDIYANAIRARSNT